MWSLGVVLFVLLSGSHVPFGNRGLCWTSIPNMPGPQESVDKLQKWLEVWRSAGLLALLGALSGVTLFPLGLRQKSRHGNAPSQPCHLPDTPALLPSPPAWSFSGASGLQGGSHQPAEGQPAEGQGAAGRRAGERCMLIPWSSNPCCPGQ